MESHSLVVKLFILAAVTLLLCIVLMRIGWLVDERQGRQVEAQSSVEQAQAGAQTLLGPLLLRNCTEIWETTETSDSKTKVVNKEQRDFQLMAVPAQLLVDGNLNQEARWRGLFKVNGYVGTLHLTAQWNSLAALQAHAEHAGGQVQCQDPQMMLATSDTRGLRAAQVQLGSQRLEVKPGTGHADYLRGLHVTLPGLTGDMPLQLQVTLELAGTGSFALVPAAAATQMTVHSNWPSPSFGGRFLPVSHEVNAQGFTAKWQVSELASTAAADVLQDKTIAGIGGKLPSEADTLQFALIDPVNPYVMSDRAIKYGLMFILLTFVCVGLVELLSGKRIHPVQYLFVGLGLSLFFLLLLSLSEHMTFAMSYLLAAGSVVLLLSHYGAAMLGGWLRGAVFGAGVALLYGALYVLLSMEQASLVVGALLLFAILAAVMTVTRRLDWYALNSARNVANE